MCASSARTATTTGSIPRRSRKDSHNEHQAHSHQADYRAALREVERLWNANPGTADGDRVDVMVTLIQAYEAKHFPIDAPDPIEAVKFMMEQKGLTRRDLEPAIGTRDKRRPLTLPMIRALSRLLAIPLDVLARDYATERAA